MMTLLKLFYIFFKIGLFSFGGGYAMLPLISQEVITNNHWLDGKEFTDLVAISQATPGPIAVNGATYVGYKVGGVPGSIFATLGVIMPSLIIMIIITRFFIKLRKSEHLENAFLFLRPATIGLIAAAAVVVASGSFIDYKSWLIFAAVFILSYRFKADPILLTITCGVIGFLIY